jgi:Asp-tRNA(Asn)/Glu-tRNA(Gln) amidotransferase A subunit family amidase
MYQFSPFFSIRATAGPFAKTVDDLTLLLRCWWDSKTMSDEDQDVPYMPFNQETYKNSTYSSSTHKGEVEKPLRVGYFIPKHDVSAAVRRSVQMGVVALKDQGYDVVPVDIDEMVDGAVYPFLKLINKGFLIDTAETMYWMHEPAMPFQ